MSSFDIILSKRSDPIEISRAVSSAYQIEDGSVLVVNEISPFISLNSSQLLVRVMDVQGDFLQILEIYPSETLSRSDVEVSSKICEKLGCIGLISDDDWNPYSWYLVSSKGVESKVFLKADEYDAGFFYLATQGL